MPTVVVPFRGESAKRRLAPAPEDVRATLANAMLEDVLDACRAVAEDVVVASGGGGQGAAVEIALKRVDSGPILVVNADLPAVQPRDLLTLVGASDGTTNALALAAPHLFAPLYGPGSAERFLARATRLDVPAAVAAIPNLADDVDTLGDLEELEGRLGPRTAASLDALRTGLTR